MPLSAGGVKRQAARLADRVIASVVVRGMDAYYGKIYYTNRWHPHHALLQDALDDTVGYIKSDMRDSLIRRDALDVLTYAAKQATVDDGLVLEFGVRSGMTINHLARRLPGATVHGFDSFEGLPEAWAGADIDAGAFGGEGMPQVASNVELHVGWFDDTLAPFLADHPGSARLVHIDSDIYSSAKTVLDNLAPRLVPGSVIVFNEYFNYPNWREHEFRAWQEHCAAHGVSYEYLCWGLYEVAVRVTAT
ncbi:MAG: class I SAM-dependent methyltransferase [Actinomycetota bacterium]